MSKVKVPTQNKHDALDACQVSVSTIAAKLVALGVLLEGQGTSADGLTQLFGLGLSLREFGEELDDVSRSLDDLGIELAKSTSGKL